MRRGKLCLCPLCAPLYAEGIAIGAAAVQATVPAASVPAVAFALTAHPVRANVLLPAPAVVRTAPQPVSQHEIDEKHAESTGDEKQGNSPRTLPVLPVCTYSDATRSAKRRQRRRAARTFPQCDTTPPTPASSRAPANARASVAPTSGSLDARPGRAWRRTRGDVAARASLAVLSTNPFFPLVIGEHSLALHQEVLSEQVKIMRAQLTRLFKKQACSTRGKRGFKTRGAQKRAHRAHLSSLLRTADHNMVVPSFSGPCVLSYLEQIGSSLPASNFMATIGLAKTALKNGWPLWFGPRLVAKVHGVTIYHTHLLLQIYRE